MMITKVKVLGSLALAAALTLGIGGATAMQFGGGAGAGQEAAAKPGGDSVEELLAKLKAEANARAKESESRALMFRRKAEELQAEVEKLRAENQNLTAQLKLMSDIRGSENSPEEARKELLSRQAELQSRLEKLQSEKAQGLSSKTTSIARMQKDVENQTKVLEEARATMNRARARSLSSSKATISGGGEITETGSGSSSKPTPAASDRPGASQAGAGATTVGGIKRTAQGRMGGMGGGGDGLQGMARGGMGGMGGPARKGLITLGTNDCMIVVKPELKKIAAYSNEKGEWSTYDIPEGIKAIPVATGNMVALQLEGNDIAKLVVYVPAQSKWYPTDLKAPFKGRAIPVLTQGMTAFTLDNRVYAFTNTANQWDVLELPEGTNPQPGVSSRQIVVENGDHIYIFSAKTGKWSDFNAADAK